MACVMRRLLVTRGCDLYAMVPPDSLVEAHFLAREDGVGIALSGYGLQRVRFYSKGGVVKKRCRLRLVRTAVYRSVRVGTQHCANQRGCA